MKKCFIFDFDCTLTISHFYYFVYDIDSYCINWRSVADKFNIEQKNIRALSAIWCEACIPTSTLSQPHNRLRALLMENQDLLLNLIFGGKHRLSLIKLFLQSLIDAEYDLYISSRGMTEDIIKIMDLFDLSKYFKEINANVRTHTHARAGTNVGKVDFILGLAKNGYEEISYVDDCNHEHTKLSKLIDSKILYNYYGSNIGLAYNANGLTTKMIKIICGKLQILLMTQRVHAYAHDDAGASAGVHIPKQMKKKRSLHVSQILKPSATCSHTRIPAHTPTSAHAHARSHPCPSFLALPQHALPQHTLPQHSLPQSALPQPALPPKGKGNFLSKSCQKINFRNL